MTKKIKVGLIIISLVAILIDCYAAYSLFLMTAMPLGHYISPFLVLLLVLTIPAIFIWSVVGLFKLRKWAYITFFSMTILFHLFLMYIDLYFMSKVEGGFHLETPKIFLVISFLSFSIFFLSPPVKRLFK